MSTDTALGRTIDQDRARSLANGVEVIGCWPTRRFEMGLHVNYADPKTGNRLGTVTPKMGGGFEVELARWIGNALAIDTFRVGTRDDAEVALATFAGIDVVVTRDEFVADVRRRVLAIDVEITV